MKEEKERYEYALMKKEESERKLKGDIEGLEGKVVLLERMIEKVEEIEIVRQESLKQENEEKIKI